MLFSFKGRFRLQKNRGKTQERKWITSKTKQLQPFQEKNSGKHTVTTSLIIITLLKYLNGKIFKNLKNSTEYSLICKLQ